MNRTEILQTANPILFHTDMVRAILDGRKTVTRRVIKFPTNEYTNKVPDADNVSVYSNTMRNENVTFHEKPFYCFDVKPPYKARNILYVRETWRLEEFYKDEALVRYKAGGELSLEYGQDIFLKLCKFARGGAWCPSIHMLKEAARIFLRVTDVRAERLQDIMKDPPGPNNQVVKEGCDYGCDFIAAWENMIKKSEREKYGWDANPWVWVIEFERVEVE